MLRKTGVIESGDPLQPIDGVRLAVAAAGIRYADRTDLLLLELCPQSATAAVFTRNAFSAAPVRVARAHLQQTQPRMFLINSGNANAGTGASGLAAARRSCQTLAACVGVAENEILPFSTGVIGEDLPVARMEQVFPQLAAGLDAANWEVAARAIMTTDTRPKYSQCQARTAEGMLRINGIAKGSGMIHPDMATMLAFLATDAVIAPPLLQQALQRAVNLSFNCITVDGDTSTNDACVLSATGRGGLLVEDLESASGRIFQQHLDQVCADLATQIIKDAEGATKFIKVRVDSARDQDEARQVAYAIALSPLVKTAFYASDPNWGRILAAVGRAGLANLAIDLVSIWLDDVLIVREGGRYVHYREEQGQRVMDQSEILVRVDLQRGGATATVLTSDLSHQYVTINAEYRT